MNSDHPPFGCEQRLRTAQPSPRWLCLIAVPSIWCVVCWLSFHHPGDEYVFWALGSLPAFWLIVIQGNAGDIHGFLWPAIAAGAASMAVIGLLLDLLHSPRRGLFLLWTGLSTFLFLCAVALGDLKRATTPAEGIAAYLLGASNVALWVSVVLILLFSLGSRLVVGQTRDPVS